MCKSCRKAYVHRVFETVLETLQKLHLSKNFHSKELDEVSAFYAVSFICDDDHLRHNIKSKKSNDKYERNPLRVKGKAIHLCILLRQLFTWAQNSYFNKFIHKTDRGKVPF